MSRVALAFKARTGRATLVALAGEPNKPQVVERAQVALLPEGEWAPYHAAQGLEPVEARKHVVRSVATARRLAASAVLDAAKRCTEAGNDVCGCAVLVGTGMPDWTTDEILAVHVRMHKAEGELFRNVLVDGVRASGIELTTLPEKSAIDAAATRLAVTRAELDARLAALGKAAGPPWGKDQKEAAAAALVVLARAGASR